MLQSDVRSLVHVNVSWHKSFVRAWKMTEVSINECEFVSQCSWKKCMFSWIGQTNTVQMLCGLVSSHTIMVHFDQHLSRQSVSRWSTSLSIFSMIHFRFWMICILGSRFNNSTLNYFSIWYQQFIFQFNVTCLINDTTIELNPIMIMINVKW